MAKSYVAICIILANSHAVRITQDLMKQLTEFNGAEEMATSSGRTRDNFLPLLRTLFVPQFARPSFIPIRPARPILPIPPLGPDRDISRMTKGSAEDSVDVSIEKERLSLRRPLKKDTRRFTLKEVDDALTEANISGRAKRALEDHGDVVQKKKRQTRDRKTSDVDADERAPSPKRKTSTKKNTEMEEVPVKADKKRYDKAHGKEVAKKAREGKVEASDVEESYYKVMDGVKYDRNLLEKVEGYAKDGHVSFAEANQVWESANDGKELTDIEKETLKYTLANLKYTEKARAFLKSQLNSALESKSYYKYIDGVKYDREILEKAELFANDGQISYAEAIELWDDAEDGKGVTDCERRTLEYTLANLKYTEKGKMFMISQLNPKTQPKSYYKQIDGVRYDRGLLERAELFAKYGEISVAQARELWEDAHSKGLDACERRTLEYTMANLEYNGKGKDFMQGKLNLKDWEDDKVLAQSNYKVIDGVKYDRNLLEKVEAYAKDGHVAFAEANQLWESAKDGKGMTDIEKETLWYALANLKYTEEVRAFLQSQLNPALESKSYYKQIGGVKYDRKILEKAELFAKDGQISYAEAIELWEDAQDGDDATECERRTLEYTLANLRYTQKGKTFMISQLNPETQPKSYYKQIDGVRYDRGLLERAELFAKHGAISVAQAKELWKDVQDGKGLADCERRTLEYTMANLEYDHEAKDFMQGQLNLNDGEDNAVLAQSYYKVIDGVKYDKNLLGKAEGFAKDGPVSFAMANLLWESANDGKGMTDIEKDTLKYTLASLNFTRKAEAFMLWHLHTGVGTKSYYKQIRGVKYDRWILDRAELFAKDGPISYAEAKQLWEEAQDGKGGTDCEKRTLEYTLANLKYTDKAKKFMESQLNAETQTKPYYKQIEGVNYDRELLEHAELCAKNGQISLADAEALWEDAQDGKSLADCERRTIDHTMVTLKYTNEAIDFMMAQLNSGESEEDKVSYYTVIDGAKYDRKLLEKAEGYAKDGPVSFAEANQLLGIANDGKGMTDIEKETLKYTLENLKYTEKAKAFLNWYFNLNTAHQNKSYYKRIDGVTYDSEILEKANLFALKGQISHPQAVELWEDAQDGKCVSRCGRRTLEYTLLMFNYTNKAQQFMVSQLNLETQAKSYYKQIKGVMYDRGLLERAELFADYGPISTSDARKLWKGAHNGKDLSDCERRTLEYTMANLKYSDKAKSFMQTQLNADNGGVNKVLAQSYYKVIEGVKYDRKLLEKAEGYAKDGKISFAEATQLWDTANDGKLMPNVEKGTLKYTLVNLDYTKKARRFLEWQLYFERDSKSYYKEIDGVRYDREILEKAESFSKNGQISYAKASELWDDAQDGKGMSDCERRTLQYTLLKHDYTDKAANFMQSMLNPETQTKSYYTKIEGVTYNHELLERAEVFARHGAISVGEAKELWEDAQNGNSLADCERRTLEYTMTNLKYTDKAKKFIQAKLNPDEGGKDEAKQAGIPLPIDQMTKKDSTIISDDRSRPPAKGDDGDGEY